MRQLALLAALLVTASAFAIDPAPRDANIDMLAADLHALGRVAAVAEDLGRSRQVLLAIVDSDIHTLRGPRDDGTYRWASLQREDGGRVTEEKTIEHVYTETELRYITVTGANGYRVEVTVPRKRGTFSSNNRVWIRNVLVDSTAFDGRTTHHEIPVNAWVNPGDSNGVPLPDIGKSVKAVVELGVESGNKSAVAEVSLVQAKLVDDPNSPYFPAMKRLIQIRDLADDRDMNRGNLRNAIDEALLSVPGELEKRTAEQERLAEERRNPKGSIAAGDATPDVVRELADVARLMSGTVADQTEGRARLQALLELLAPISQP
jgi:hypothetical protein